MSVRHRWTIDADRLLAGARQTSQFADYSTWDAAHFRSIHPLLLADGDLITKDHYSPPFRIDACGARRWINDRQMFHHSTEVDADGNLWIPALAEPHRLARLKDSYHEDLLTKVDPAGRILYTRAVDRILTDHGLTHLLFTNGMYNDDPTHLNDIQPVLADGPYWKQGDLFLSLRNISTILLYRPATDRIVWMKRGPWMAQHDVDILDDHRIGVYDNNAQDRGTGMFVDGSSDIDIYDFATDSVSRPLTATMRQNQIRTFTAGLFTALPNGGWLVEDVTKGRLLIVRRDGRVGAAFVNRAANGDVYHLGWSRYIPQSEGDRIVTRLQKVGCLG